MVSPKVLLLQARRPEDPMAAHEVQAFKAQCTLEPDDFHVWNLVEAAPSLPHCQNYDAIIIGGSGDFYVSKRDQPHFVPFLDVLASLVAKSLPIFGVCYGYQSLAEVLGGKVDHLPHQAEVGTYSLDLTPAGLADPLLGQMPSRFKVQQGHKDQVTVHPSTGVNLAVSQRCPHQAFRIEDKPIWGVQFHPELTHVGNKERFVYYLEGYATAFTEEEQEDIMSRFDESPEASSLLQKFLDLIFDR